MFENLSLLELQQYWWIIISILASLLVFLMFVQGGQSLIFQIAKNENEKLLLVNALGRKWELTFTTLVTFGGAFFASFPLFYSVSFGGSYWLWIIILLGFIVQAISYEYRKKSNNILGSHIFELFLTFNGISATFFLGIIVSTMFTGSAFTLDKFNLSTWQSASNGLEAFKNIQNIILGLSLFFLTRTLGAMFFLKYIDNVEILARAGKNVLFNGITFTILFVIFLVFILTKNGYTFNPETNLVYFEKYKYFNNFIEMPIILVLFLLGVITTLFGIYTGSVKHYQNSFFISGIGVILVIFSLFINLGFNNTSFYPSASNLQSSLTIINSSSSKYTLAIMSYVTLLIPFVAGYIIYVWKVLSKNKINKQELENTGHVY